MKKLLCAFIGVMVCVPCFAEMRNTTASITKSWGAVNPLYCGGHNYDACIGDSARDNCRAYGLAAGTSSSTYGMLVMMARIVNVHGALFCPTQIDPVSGRYLLWHKLWTYYREPGENNTCVWLCRAGYTGPECNVKVEDFTGTCDVVPFLRSNYDNAKLHYGGENIEFEVPMFAVDTALCSGRFAEYDVVLLVNKWLNSGNGAFVRKMMVRTKSSDGAGTIMIYPASESVDILVCKNGYRPNAGQTDCEPIDAQKCNEAIVSSNMCAGWNLSAYNQEEHEYAFDGTCYRYACKQVEYAFNSDIDHTCSECAVDKRNGVHPTDGTCIKCGAGQIFNKDDATNNYCNVAVGLTKSDLMYGRGKTRNSNADIVTQCWTQTDPLVYRDCVMNGGLAQKVKTETIDAQMRDFGQ